MLIIVDTVTYLMIFDPYVNGFSQQTDFKIRVALIISIAGNEIGWQ